MDQATPSATVKDLMTAAVATYLGKNAPTMSAQWSPVPLQSILSKDQDGVLASGMSSVGFYGQAYVNQHTGEVLIANRGTDNWQNFVTDVSVAREQMTDAQPVADAFAIAAVKASKEQLEKAGSKMTALYTAGHSLGGAESESQAALLSVAMELPNRPLVPPDVHITNISIDAPGVAQLAHRGNPSRYTSYNFSTQGDVVNRAGGEQAAGTIRVTLPIGPTFFQTAGYMEMGGAILNAPLIERGATNALAAHSSALVLGHVSATPLADIKVTQLGESETEILRSFVPVASKNASVGDGVDHSHADAANDARRTELDRVQIWGINADGSVDMAAIKSGANGAYAEQWLDDQGYACRVRVGPKGW